MANTSILRPPTTQISPPGDITLPIIVTFVDGPVNVFVYFIVQTPSQQTVKITFSSDGSPVGKPLFYSSGNTLTWGPAGAITFKNDGKIDILSITATINGSTYNNPPKSFPPPSFSTPGWSVTVFEDSSGNKAIICVADAGNLTGV